MIHAMSYRLGLDLGASSLGWAVVRLDQPNGDPQEILAAGVRIFEAGVEGDIEQGKDSSKAVKRRQARQPRRQQWRRQFRKRKLFTLLQQFGLLPPSSGNTSADRKAALDALDDLLKEKHVSPEDHDAHQKLPYLLRAKAAEEILPPHELGRALYHLAQRRGYLSNRKGQRDDDDTGLVEGSIDSLRGQMGDATLGQFFARQARPAEKRIRRRYTGRTMYREEFDRIRAVQGSSQGLGDKDWEKLRQAIFYQRPLKSQKHLIGRCELEPHGKRWKYRRCDLCLPIAQEFRILQKVNDLRVTTAGRRDDPLTPKEREKLIAALWTQAEMTWGKVKSLLKLPKTARFSHEEGGEKLIGHRTNAKMIAAFGNRWLDLSEAEQTDIAREVLHFRKPEALKKRAMHAWNLTEEQAEKLSRTKLEEGYASHSRQALRKLIDGTDSVPGLRQGAPYATVRKALYPESFTAGKAFDTLPPVNNWKNDIRNPAVIRAMTELRKVVNEIIRKFGKPDSIHIELSRDLRNSRQKRKDIWKQNEENRKRREKAAQAILNECRIGNPNRRQIEKWLLAEECNKACPYCGKSINFHSLMGDDAEFNIEHIYPRRYLDNSYMNKTIACRSCNDQKGDRTPAQAFTGARFDEILQRVERFQGAARDAKLHRFKTEIPDADFVTRQMNDTRYNSRLAAQYLGLLYGGRADQEHKQRVFTPTGQLTGSVRNSWQLNDLLGEPDDEKERGDHRHHAIDAVIIALLDQRLIHQISSSAEEAEKLRDRHFFKPLPWPWNGFKNDVAFAIEAINVSHRPTRTIAGPLHAESIYSKNHGTEKQPDFRIRKELAKLTAKEISGDQIVDPSVRAAVQKKYEELGGGLPSKLWGDRDDLDKFPRLPSRNGSGPGTIIRKVRLRTDAKPRSIGRDARQRNIASGKDSNYASMVYAVLDAAGNEIRWEHEIITRLEAHERLSANHGRPGEKVLIPKETETRKFKFALRKNDMIEADGPDGTRVLYRVQNLSVGEIQLCDHHLSTILKPNRTAWDRITNIDKLRLRNANFAQLNALGNCESTSDP